jgi:hypothetical protein
MALPLKNASTITNYAVLSPGNYSSDHYGETQLAIVKPELLWGSISNAVSALSIIISIGVEPIRNLTVYSSLTLLLLASILATFVKAIVGTTKFEFYNSYFVRASKSKSECFDYSEIRSVKSVRSGIKISMRTRTERTIFHRGKKFMVHGNPRIYGIGDLVTFLDRKARLCNSKC